MMSIACWLWNVAGSLSAMEPGWHNCSSSRCWSPVVNERTLCFFKEGDHDEFCRTPVTPGKISSTYLSLTALVFRCLHRPGNGSHMPHGCHKSGVLQFTDRRSRTPGWVRECKCRHGSDPSHLCGDHFLSAACRLTGHGVARHAPRSLVGEHWCVPRVIRFGVSPLTSVGTSSSQCASFSRSHPCSCSRFLSARPNSRLVMPDVFSRVSRRRPILRA